MNTEEDSTFSATESAHTRDEKFLSLALIGVVLVMLLAIVYVGVVIYRAPYHTLETLESLPRNTTLGATAP
jgi:hypothetical protein